MPNLSFTLDANLQLKDSHAVTSTNWDEVASADKTINLKSNAYTEFLLVHIITAIDVDGGSELYTLRLDGSDNTGFSSDMEALFKVEYGGASALTGDVATTTGIYVWPVSNERGGVTYQYLRGWTLPGGSGVTTGITHEAYLTKR